MWDICSSCFKKTIKHPQREEYFPKFWFSCGSAWIQWINDVTIIVAKASYCSMDFYVLHNSLTNLLKEVSSSRIKGKQQVKDIRKVLCKPLREKGESAIEGFDFIPRRDDVHVTHNSFINEVVTLYASFAWLSICFDVVECNTGREISFSAATGNERSHHRNSLGDCIQKTLQLNCSSHSYSNCIKHFIFLRKPCCGIISGQIRVLLKHWHGHRNKTIYRRFVLIG